ncbi:DUF6029 family protein [Lacihabitans soyangensis]|uniref:DUF5723 domain-containing protein n=1 Tax=Lacihabitans soyangensis TaxID=869394 RepID=A0AAE3KRM2_9BACT|nr:DUF6029 family protein [Lacihabitans soyangensis]MCP9762263.1 hypothetical protein [Lacihabitans soyangensis]
MKVLFAFLISTQMALATSNPSDSVKTPLRFWGNLRSSHILYNQSLNPFVYYPNVSNQSYADIYLQKNKITAGIRLESYLEPQVGMPDEMKGWGLASKFVKYKHKRVELGLGNHYEQFGTGLIFKTQEQRAIGMDNSLDGFWGNFILGKIIVKSLTGKQRVGFKHANGWVSGLDVELRDQVNNSLFFVGLSNVLKTEKNEVSALAAKELVYATALRTGIQGEKLSVNLEYASKSVEFEEMIGNSNNRGSAIVGIFDWSNSKNALVLHLKRTENMDFRSERGTRLNTAVINFIPNFTKLNTYRLLTLYPYASQVMAEIGGQLDWTYFTENGVELNANFSLYQQPKLLENPMPLYREIGLEYAKDLNENSKLRLLANYAHFNKGIVLGGFPEIVKYQAIVLDITHKINKNLSLNTQAQHLYTRQDKGSWALALVDLRIKSKWSVFVTDEVNYSQNEHYYQVGSNFNLGSKTLGISYGKVREGLFCVGGVCQIIPEYEGLSVNFGINF